MGPPAISHAPVFEGFFLRLLSIPQKRRLMENIGGQLVEVMLQTADSMQQLQDELDRISLHAHDSPPSDSLAVRTVSRRLHKKRKSQRHRHGASAEPLHCCESERGRLAGSCDTLSVKSEDGSDRPSSPGSSSRFDSAFGSLHSQTDNDSLSSHLSFPAQSYSLPQPYRHLRESAKHPSPAYNYDTAQRSYGIASNPVSNPASSSIRSESRRIVETAVVEQYFSPQQQMVSLVPADNTLQPRHTQPQLPTASRKSPTQAEEKTNYITVQGAVVELRQREHKPKTQQHRKLTSEDTRKHLKWLQSSQSELTPASSNEEHEAVDRERGESEVQSEISSSSTVEEDPDGGFMAHTATLEMPGPEETKREEHRYGSSWVRVKDSPRSKPHKKVKGLLRSQSQHKDEGSSSTQFYQDNLTPESSPLIRRRYQPSNHINMPLRYRTTKSHSHTLNQEQSESSKQQQPVRRSTSILQRLKRRNGSFRRYRGPRLRIPVQRSFSDRFVYHLKRRWVDHEEDLYPVSNPSLLRPIGRLLRTHTGQLHIIELHKPPDGHFGIYISQGEGKKIFISRFASNTAKKFYTGLLTPGDEIVSVNDVQIKDKSLDYVYGILSRLSSVVLSVVPVSAHRNW